MTNFSVSLGRRVKGRWYIFIISIYLIIAHVAVKTLPFPWIKIYMNRKHNPKPMSKEKRNAHIRGTQWCLLKAEKHLPLKIQCFARALAACTMLRKVGIPTRIHYGIVRKPEGIKTHAWLSCERVGIIGHEIACEFNELFIFPEKKI